VKFVLRMEGRPAENIKQPAMNLMSLRRLATQVLVVAAALAAMLTSGAPAQSLGTVARQEEARRKGTETSGKAPGKVYTNEDLRGAPAAASPAEPSTSAPSSATPAPPAAAAKPDAAKPADGNAKSGDAKAGDAPNAKTDTKPDPRGDQATWQKRRQDLQDALDRSKTFADALQSRINGLTADFAARDDPAQRARVGTDRQKALTELERVKKEIVLNTKALADLQEEARKSGVPAGWLR
jgi:hypothetical protein